jgi:phosphatidylserine/phosphatidylglycerophosphate/cardiolipin synthase-like enzyme
MLLAMACGSLPLDRAAPMPTPTGDPATSSSDPTATPVALEASSMSEIPLHVGHGVRGPWFDVYFSDPSNPLSTQMTGGLDERLVAAVDAARLSVHAAIFNITLNALRDALLRAHRRGVEVRLVTESDNMDGEDLQLLIAGGIPVLGDRRESTMHNKFMVVDGAEVWTGSMNFTVSGTYLDNNTLVRISSAALAYDYETEFGEMFEDDKFGDRTGRPTPYPQVEIAGTQLEVYFSPDDGVEAAIVDLLDSAEQSIHFLAFSFTSDRLGDAIRRANGRSAQERVVMRRPGIVQYRHRVEQIPC